MIFKKAVNFDVLLIETADNWSQIIFEVFVI